MGKVLNSILIGYHLPNYAASRVLCGILSAESALNGLIPDPKTDVYLSG